VRTQQAYVAAQRAVLGTFFFIGVPVGMLIPRLAEIKSSIAAGDAAYGSAIALGGLGAVLGNYLGARFVHHSGSKLVTKVAITLSLLATISNALVPSVSYLALVAFFGGFAYSMANIAINSQGVLIEQALKKSFLPKGHAYWSIGAMLFGLISSLIAPYLAPLFALSLGALISVFGFIYFTKDLLPIEYDDRPHDDPTQLPRKEKIPRTTFKFLVLIAVGQWLGTISEFATGDWSSVLLLENFKIPVGPNGYAYATFMFTLLISRLSAPKLIDRFGLQNVVRTLGLVGATGLIIFLQLANATFESNPRLTLVFACLAFGFTGMGVANMPAAFYSAAGRIPGLPSARALMVTGLITSLLSLLGRVGLATISEKFNLVIALSVGGLALLVAAGLAYLLKPEHTESHAIKR